MKDERATSASQALKPAASVHTRRFDEELVILDLAGGEYFALDAIGAKLWSGLDGGKSVADVATEVAQEYDVGFETVLADLEELVRELRDRGLLVSD